MRGSCGGLFVLYGIPSVVTPKWAVAPEDADELSIVVLTPRLGDSPISLRMVVLDGGVLGEEAAADPGWPSRRRGL
eukprot:12922754-Prorocentrum_lima.AAC.1